MSTQADRLAEPLRTDASAGSVALVSTSIDRALDILIGLANDRPMGVTEVAKTVDLPKSTTHRLLKILEARGLATRVGSKYTLGVALFELGSAVRAWPSSNLGDASRR